MGYKLSEEKLKEAFQAFKSLTDRKKEVTDDDLFTILMDVQIDTKAISKYELDVFQVQYGTSNIPTATVSLRTPRGESIQAACTGQGSVEALYNTLDNLIEEELKLLDYQLNSVGSGKDALAESYVQLSVNGTTVNGRGTAQDVLKASSHAFLNAVNRYIIKENTSEKELVKNS